MGTSQYAMDTLVERASAIRSMAPFVDDHRHCEDLLALAKAAVDLYNANVPHGIAVQITPRPAVEITVPHVNVSGDAHV